MDSNSSFDFQLEEIPIPGIPVRPSNLLHIPVPEDGPAGARELRLPFGISPSREDEYAHCSSPAQYATLDTDGLLMKFTKDTKAFCPIDDILLTRTGTPTFTKSVLGTELAKKRLQAFCIQKKQTNTAGSPSSLQLTPNSSTSPLLIGNKVQGSLKRVSNVSKTNCLEEISEKMKISAPKKTYKKAMNGYERSRTTLTEILELKKEEDTKLALVKLGIPLGLVPGLTPKAMPTKAMPPIKQLLDPEQVELLLNKAKLLPDDFQLKFKSLISDDKKLQKFKPFVKNDRNDNFRHKYHNHSRSDRGRYSERWDDNRNDRNDRQKTRRRHSSHSRSNRRSPESSSRRSNHHSSSSRARKESPKDFRYSHSKRDSSIEKVKSDIYTSDFIEKHILVPDVYEDNIQQNATEAIAEFELVREKNDMNIFSIDKSIKSIVSDDNVSEKENATLSHIPKINEESHLIYSKFLRDKFVPISELCEMADSITECVSSSERDTSHGRKMVANLVENYNTMPTTFNKCQEFDLSYPYNSDKVLYSPGMESSREPTPLFQGLPFTNDESFVPDIDQSLKDDFNIESEKVDDVWIDIEQMCHPNKHSSISCFRKTCTKPSLDYCENLNNCQCVEVRTKCYEKLLSNVDFITASMSINQSCDKIENLARIWYPRTENVFKDISQLEVYSNWEDDSSSLPSNPVQKLQNKLIFQKPDNIPLHKENSLNFKNLNAPPIIGVPRNYVISSNANLIDNVTCIPMPGASSLDSEYEKFMEAVWPEIADECNEAEKNLDFNTANEILPVISNNSDFQKISVDSKTANGNFHSENDMNSNFNIESKVESTSEKIIFSNLNKCNSKANREKSFPPDILAEDLIININANEKKIIADCWSSDNLSDDQKKEKYVSSNHLSVKPTKQRKGHAKISSRRHKGKKKKSSQKDFYQSSSTTDSSFTYDDSSSESSSSKDGSRSDDGTTSSNDASATSSLRSTSSDESTSSTDFSSSSSSGSSSDQMRSKSKKKLAFSKKKYKKLSKSKRKKKQLLAKAKELAKKLKLKKKKRKLKERLVRENKSLLDDTLVHRKEIMTELKILYDNENTQLAVDNSKIPNLKKSRKRVVKDKKNKMKHKKRKLSAEIDSSDGSYSSSESDQSGTEKISNKRARDSCDSEFNTQSKKSKNFDSDFIEDENYVFNVNKLTNMKKEKISDEEESHKAIKNDELSRNSRFRQQIINASELQNDFLKGNKSKDDINNAVIKTDISRKNNNKKLSSTKLPLNENFDLQENNKMHSNIVLQLNPNIKYIKKSNVVVSSIKNMEDNNTESHHYNYQTEKIDTTRIGKIECDWRPSTRPQLYREKRPSRWGSISDRDTSFQDIDLATIETAFQMETNTYETNSYAQIETGSEIYQPNQDDIELKSGHKIYQIQTISSRNIVPNTQNFDNDLESYENYDVFDKQHMEVDDFIVDLKSEFNDARTPLRKISLDDRINMVLKYPGIEGVEQSLQNEKSPEKGILTVGGARLTRVDPRITKGKKVSFADGFAPGQDSDCENELANSVIPPSSPKGKKKKRKSCGGHAYPCPPNWPDYHPRWDKLPPPAPPPGSPLPELCDKTNNSILTNSNALSRIPRVPNVMAS